MFHSEKETEAIQLWTELADEDHPFAPALLSLARHYSLGTDKANHKLAVEFYTRYGEAEPEDPSTHTALADLYDGLDDYVRAEAEHRAALKSDPENVEQLLEFATFLAARKRFVEAASIIDEADKRASKEDDPFGSVMSRLYFRDDKPLLEELASSQPQRMDKSASGNLYLAYLRIENGASLQAISLLKKTAALEKDWTEPLVAMADAYRKLRNWTAALKAADAAIKIEPEDAEAYFSKACALARLGRLKEAMQALEKAVELDSDLSETIGDEADLKVLASRPEFKKLLVPQESN